MVFYITSDKVLNGRINHIDIGGETVVRIVDCPELVELPCWPNVTNINCINCPDLVSLPCWPNVEEVNCRDCPRLLFIPNWSQRVDVRYKNCPNIQKQAPLVMLQTDYLQSAFVPEFINL